MQDFVRRHSLALSSGLLITLSVILTSASVADKQMATAGAGLVLSMLAPFERMYQGIFTTIRGYWGHYIYLMGVEEERNQLAMRLKALESQNSQFVELRGENDRLRALLNYKVEEKADGKAATVISRDSSNWAQSITIDRGSNDSIQVGLPVLDGNAIVGQVIAVSGNSAKVQLLTDSVSAIDSIVQSSRALGVAEGTLARTLKLRYVLRDQPVKVGDRIIASGLDGVYPKGALVGFVSKVDTATGMFQDVEIETSVDVSRLENVFVRLKDPT